MVSYNFRKGISHYKDVGLLPILQLQKDLGLKFKIQIFLKTHA